MVELQTLGMYTKVQANNYVCEVLKVLIYLNEKRLILLYSDTNKIAHVKCTVFHTLFVFTSDSHSNPVS